MVSDYSCFQNNYYFLALDCFPPDIKQTYRNLHDFKKGRELNCKHWRSTIRSLFQYIFHFISLKCISRKLDVLSVGCRQALPSVAVPDALQRAGSDALPTEEEEEL